tara:strand:+ start:1208 stop:1507 length:300 start_codon:yes stop_codon:yes gene_type:complete
MTNKVSGDCVICEDPEIICPQHEMTTEVYSDPNSVFQALSENSKDYLVIDQLQKTLFTAYHSMGEGSLFWEEEDSELIDACHTLIEYYGMSGIDFNKKP